VVIDEWNKTTNASAVNDVTWFFTNGFAKFIIGSSNSSDVMYSFVNGVFYNILLQVTVKYGSASPVMYQSVYKFNYLNPTPSLDVFDVSGNVASGDNIIVTNLNILNSSSYPNDNPVSVVFSFNHLELASTDVNDEIHAAYNPELPYDPSGNYTLLANTLHNDSYYDVTATAMWIDPLGNDGYETSENSTDKLFVIARPSINSVTAYDAQNDGGDDGVSSDSAAQVIATITLGDVGYVKYKPSTVKFIFYDASGVDIGSSVKTYDASNNALQSYDIKLNDVTLKASGVKLLNGMPGYTVNAQVEVPISIDGNTYDQTRTSDPKPIVFRQGVAHVLPLTIGNTWDLICAGDPSTTTLSASQYNLIPNLGISGYFKKNAQFGSGYSKNLDKPTTKFLLQYSIGGSSTRTNVVKAALVQRAANEANLVDAIYRASTGAVVSSTDGDGKYANVVGPSNVLGSDQKELVFYIPGPDNGLNETNNVNIFVTIVDDDNQWLDPSDNSIDNQSSAVSDDVIMVNKIPIYSYTPAEASEPSINNVDVSNNVVNVLNNKVLSQVDKSDIISDSAASIITQSFKGWAVKNPSAVSGVVPKVNLYYYKQSMSSSTFTMGDINQDTDLGMWYVIDQNEDAKRYPFLIAYTKRDASGNAASWYKSKILYGPVASSDATQSGFTLLYTGTDNGSLYPEIPTNRRVKLDVSVVYSNPSSPNATLSSEEVNLVSIHTSSNASEINAGDFDFNLLYAGVVRNGSYTTTLFTDPLLNVNIPIDTSFSTYSDNTLVNNINTPSGGFVISESNDSLSSFVLPVLTQSKYNVQYSIKNPNNADAIVKGLVSADTTVSTLNEPQLTDFTVSNFSFHTVNSSHNESSILFDLSFNPYALDRIDGVHVYFTSDSSSSIQKIKIGTYNVSQSSIEINLLDPSSNTLAFGNNLTWNPYTSATITFVPFRDNRVHSAIVETDNDFAKWTAPTVWNIPKIAKPSLSGSITLTGGVVNSSDNTVLNWVNDTGAAYNYPVSFSYTLTMAKDSASANNEQVDISGNIASAVLTIASNTNNAYTLTLKKVFQGQSSDADTITFNSVKVDTSVMVVSVLNPSHTSSVKAIWVAPTITGTGSSFANNVASLCMTDNGVRLDNSVNAATIETSNRSYSLTQSVGTVLKLQLKVTALVQYVVNSGSSTNSSAVSLGLSPFTNYTVSTVPEVSFPATSTVLIQNTSTPTLLMNLNAKGLEAEGFISLVVVITQDGTPEKPEGCEVLLQFPLAPTSSNPFSFQNVVGASGAVTANLVGAESSTAVPINVTPTGLSNNVGSYTLTIGSANVSGNNVGRYGLSSLTFPASSGFVNGQQANIMAILSSRRGTDVTVGEFTFATPPVASAVSVSTSGGNYYINFTLN
jgi:hypothetical protein